MCKLHDTWLVLLDGDIIGAFRTWDRAMDHATRPANTCHCGRPIYTDPDGHTRGLCAHCDAVRCDAYPGECRDRTF